MEKIPSKRLKKKREKLSLEKKYQIIEYIEAHPELTQEDIGKLYNIERSTISKILCQRALIKQSYFSETRKFDVNIKSSKFPCIDDAVFIWFAYAPSKKLIITHELLTLKALNFKREFLSKLKDSDEIDKLEKFKGSGGWIRNFKKCFQLKSKYMHGESGSIDPKKEKAARQLIIEKNRYFAPDEIFNGDET